MHQSRQLAAIMFTDIVGYTAMMQQNEKKAVAVIKHYNSSLEKWVKHFNGQILNYYGDGSLCIFSSVTDAVNCSLAIQKVLKIEPVVPLRIGLHIGEVFFENAKALGDGVNVASRIQSLAQENTILISGEIHDKIKNNASITAASLGHFDFKNVGKSMEVFALTNEGLFVPQRKKIEGKLKKKNFQKRNLIAALSLILLVVSVFFIYKKIFPETDTARIDKSIAVLPFTNMSGDTANEYFSEGITDEIITQLSKIADLRVTSRTSIILYKGTKKTLQQIAKELNVATILEGGIQKSGETVRINAQLIDANTDAHIWADNYTRNIKDIFSIQSEVAQQIAHELHVRLLKEEKINIEKKPTNNPEAYDLFLKGRYAYNNSTLEGYHGAEVFFQEAIKKDPDFRLAYSYLANVYISLALWPGDLSPSIGARKSMNVLNNILQKDTLYIDFATLAFIEFFANKNFSKAEYYFKRAISVNPNDELSHIVYAILLTNLGRTEEALLQLDIAKTLSPVNPYEIQQRGEAYYSCGRYDEAIKIFEEAIKVFPDVIIVYDDLGRVYVFKEKYAEAINILTEGLTHSTTKPPSTLAYMAIAHFKMNNTKKASELIQELKQRANRGEKGTNIFIAIYYSAINNKDEAFKYLDQALNTNDVDLIWLKQEPSFSNLHADARYNMYLKKVGF